MRGWGVSPCLQVEYSFGPTYFMLFTHSALHDWSSEGSASEPWLIGASRAAGPARIGLPAWTEPAGAPLVLKPSVLFFFFFLQLMQLKIKRQWFNKVTLHHCTHWAQVSSRTLSTGPHLGDEQRRDVITHLWGNGARGSGQYDNHPFFH